MRQRDQLLHTPPHPVDLSIHEVCAAKGHAAWAGHSPRAQLPLLRSAFNCYPSVNRLGEQTYALPAPLASSAWRLLQRGDEADGGGALSFSLPQSLLSPSPPRRCAVVGPSGILRGSRCGRRIDSTPGPVFRTFHEKLPIGGALSGDVGRRVDLVLKNGKPTWQRRVGNRAKKIITVGTLIAEWARKQQVTSNVTALLLDGCGERVGEEWRSIARDVRRDGLLSHAIRLVPLRSSYANCVDLFWRRKIRHTSPKRSRTFPVRFSSGLMLVSLALDLCDKVDVYGFWPFESKNGSRVPYHYNEAVPTNDARDVRLAANRHHSWNTEWHLLSTHGPKLRLHTEACTAEVPSRSQPFNTPSKADTAAIAADTTAVAGETPAAAGKLHACSCRQSPHASPLSDRSCTEYAGNVNTSHAGVALLPAAERPLRAQLRRWVTVYDEAMRSQDTSALLDLRASNLSQALSLHPSVPTPGFFDYINSHLPWVDALERWMGLDALWQPQRSVLAIGSAHAMIDAYLSTKHGHAVHALDLPWVYLRGNPQMAAQLRSIHCREILTSPFSISFLAHARHLLQTLEPRSYDAVTFGGSTISVLQKVGRDAGYLLEQAARLARKWIVIFLQPLVPTGATPMGPGESECAPLAPQCRPGRPWEELDEWKSTQCNVVPNCRDEKAWRAFIAAHAPSFKVSLHGTFGSPRVVKAQGAKVTLSVTDAHVGNTATAGGKFRSQKWFVLTRTVEGGGAHGSGRGLRADELQQDGSSFIDSRVDVTHGDSEATTRDLIASSFAQNAAQGRWSAVCATLWTLPRPLSMGVARMLFDLTQTLSNAQQHHVAAWLAVAGPPAHTLLDAIFSRPMSVARTNFLHGATWQLMLEASELSLAGASPQHAVEFGMELCGAHVGGSPSSLFTCLHGVGHGAFYLALREWEPAAFAQAYGTCTGFTAVINVTDSALGAAEAICSAAPSAELAHVCAEGLYMTYRAVMEPLSAERSMSDRLKKGGAIESLGWSRYASYAALETSPEMALCARRRFCDMCTYQVSYGLLTARRWQVPKPKCTAPIDEPDIVQKLCSSSAWHNAAEWQRRGCIFGVSSTMAARRGGRCTRPRLQSLNQTASVPTSTDIFGTPHLGWCRRLKLPAGPAGTQAFAACIAGIFYQLQPYVHELDLERAGPRVCAALCRPLLSDPSPQIRAAYEMCIRPSFCHSEFTEPYVSVNAELFEPSPLTLSRDPRASNFSTETPKATGPSHRVLVIGGRRLGADQGTSMQRPRTHCMRGQSLLVAIALFGNSTPPASEGEDPRNLKRLTNATRDARAQLYSHFAITLASLAAAVRDGVHVYVDLHVTHPLPSTFKVPAALHVNVSVHTQVTTELAGMYRARFREASGAFDWFMVADYDLNVRPHTLDALCTEFGRLAHRPELYPSALLYERDDGEDPYGSLNANATFAPEFCHWLPPHVERMTEVAGEKYMVLRNPYQAMWLLPASRFQSLLVRLEHRGIDWLHLPQPYWPVWPESSSHGSSSQLPQQMPPVPAHSYLPGGAAKANTQRASFRALYAGGWLFGFMPGGPSLTAVVPRATYLPHLVHHLTDLYTRDKTRWRAVQQKQAPDMVRCQISILEYLG